eukprot:1176991-Prorocentrum_minimum.AAC.4
MPALSNSEFAELMARAGSLKRLDLDCWRLENGALPENMSLVNKDYPRELNRLATLNLRTPEVLSTWGVTDALAQLPQGLTELTVTGVDR